MTTILALILDFFVDRSFRSIILAVGIYYIGFDIIFCPTRCFVDMPKVVTTGKAFASASWTIYIPHFS